MKISYLRKERYYKHLEKRNKRKKEKEKSVIYLRRISA